mgnify:CR=1 FL=1
MNNSEKRDQDLFDSACVEFTTYMQYVADWKNNYYGAAYSTRLKKAIIDARLAADRLERTLSELGEDD